MVLTPFSAQFLRLDEPLPFGLRNAEGQLLLPPHQRVVNTQQLEGLCRQPLFADDADPAGWQRQPARAGIGLAEQWQDLVLQLDATLAAPRPGSEWRMCFFAVHSRARALFQRHTDASLYHLVYEAGQSTHKYSSHHALLSMVMAEQAAGVLGWKQAWVDSLGRAALAMNVSMLRLQDRLAAADITPTSAMRAHIQGHAEASARLLEVCGVADTLCLAVVQLHHDKGQADEPLAELAADRQLARLLRRVDIFCAKISRRAKRAPMSPVRAASEACIGTGGVPDEIGGALLKAVGMYPPGSFVELANGEVGIVVARGDRANQPQVAALLGAGGAVLAEPALRHTQQPEQAVKAAVTPSRLKLQPPHERVLALR